MTTGTTGQQNVRLVLTGQSGTGKSTALRWLLDAVLRSQARSTVCLVDHKGDHWTWLRQQGFVRVVLGPEQAASQVDWQRLQSQHPLLYIHADGLLQDERIRLADELGWQHLATPNSVLIFEECSYYYPATGRRPEGLERLAHAGRANGADLWLVCQRLQDVHPQALSAANYVIAFRLREPNSRKKCAQLLGGGADVESALAELPNFSYLESDIERGLIRRGRTPGPI